EGRYIDVNEAFVAATGYTREEVIGRNSTECGLWPNPDARKAIGRRLQDHGRLDRHPCRFRMKDGSLRDFLWSAEVIDWGGESCALSVLIDTTEIHRAEHALRASESKFRALTDVAPVSVSISREERFCYVNEAWEAMTGYTREESLELSPMAIVHPDMRETVRQRAAGRLRGEDQPTRYKIKFTTRDGEARWGDFSVTVIDFDGQPAILSMARDITTQIETEERLHASEKRLAEIIDFLPDATWVVDQEGKVVAWNQAIEKLTGIPAKDIIGKGDYQYALPLYGEKRPVLIDLVREPHTGIEEHYVHLERDGSKLISVSHHPHLKPGGVYIAGTASPLYDAEGHITGAIESLRDITNQKQAEILLEETRRQQEAILNNIPDMAWLKDRESRFIAVNEAFGKICNCSPEEIAGRTDLDFFPEELARAYRADDRHVVDSGQRKFLEEKLVDADGTARWIETFKTPIYSDAGEVVGTAGIAHDITRRRRMEEQLRDSEEKFSKAFQSSPDAVYIARMGNGQLLEVNDGFTRVTGYRREEVLGKPIHTINLWYDPQTHNEIVAAMGSEGVLRERDLRFRTKAGELRDGLLSGEILHIREEACLLTVVRDITDQKRAEKALRSSEERYREFFTNAPFGIFLSTDDGRFLDVNPALAKMMGYDNARQAIDDIRDIGTQLFVAAEQREAIIAAAMATEGFHVAEVRYRRKNGTQWLAYLHMRHISGQRPGRRIFEGFVEEITERRAAELALVAEKERLRVTLHSIGDAVITTDREGCVTLMNPIAETLTAWREPEAVGLPLAKIFRIFNEATGQPCANPVEAVLASGRIVALANHTKLVSRDGSEYVIADSGAPILDADHNIIGVVLVFRDVTTARRMEAELLKTEKLKSLGVLAGGIAHDFNNFLAGIVGNLSLAKLDLPPGNPVHPRLDEMEKAALRAKNLTLQLLTFAKGGEPDKRTIPIGDLVRETASFALRGSHIRCRFNLPPDIHMAEVDEGQMTQVIHNLMINATQAMPEGGEVGISGENVILAAKNHLALAPGPYLRLTVQDAGTGIPPEHLRKVFDPYFTTKQKGSGLGLAVAYSIIEKHAGKLSIDSELGIGTTIHIHLPAAKGPAAAPLPTSDDLIKGKGRILVMDDEEFIRTLAQDMLSTLGYKVKTARDGEDAVASYIEARDAGQPFDAVILDLTVPGGMGGKETIAQLRERDPAVKAIVSSGYSNDPVIANYARYGFQAAVKKPYRLQEISKALHSLLTPPEDQSAPVARQSLPPRV
ncbi:MAG: PAS domain S-box protein, partial [Desulfobacterales bacterium]|nr:PAS domain S-box protein [Desulfobacterales bacterium]